ncbi:MAG: FIST C-terminal domain-containing protein [Spirochaetaceae bacterium]|jgi:hypothetical protein|nr:FIST C-terminal domain-containing protein [Spirochaetaceae bacterium]
MIKTYVAGTMEIDDEEAAVSEILEQLDPENNLKKNSVGIITCNLEFMEVGIVKALCGKLPFNVVGINTMSTATPGEADTMMLGITVLTSDDVFFSVGVSEPLAPGQEGPIQELFNKTAAALPDKPEMILSFAPLLAEIGGGDTVVRELDAASGGLPNFGTLAIDFTTQIRDPRVIFNGDTWKDRLVIVLLCGNFEPRFSVTRIPEARLLKQRAIITKSAGNIIMEVNDMPVGAYFESLGLAVNGHIANPYLIPLVIDFNDNAKPVTRTIHGQSPEGYCICGGAVPEGCSMAVGSIDVEDVLKTAIASIEARPADPEEGLLFFSCAGRNFALGLDIMAELKAVRESLGTDRPYMFAYSGGEICPVLTNDGNLKNRFHNVTLICCSFK